MKEGHGVKQVSDLLHQVESRGLVFVGQFSEIHLQEQLFFLFVRNNLVRNRRQVGIPIIQESRFPVNEPRRLPSNRRLSGLNRSL